MSLMNIFTAVVIYNKRCNDSTTCESLKKIRDVQVIILDNSTELNDNAEYCTRQGWQYISMGGNMGLAKAYNRAVEALKANDSVLCLFDDDSEVVQGYYDSLRQTLAAQPLKKVLLPLIYDSHGLMSPSVTDGLAVRRAEKIEEITQQNITGVNSGMAICLSVFDNYRYDEGYFLDYIDHAFLRDMRRIGNEIGYFDAQIKHETMFETQTASVDTIRKRFKIFKKDLGRFCGKTLQGRLAYQKEIIRQKYYFTTNDSLKFGEKLGLLFF